MITTKDLESLGWKHRSTAKNGGSKSFKKGEYISHADNFIMERKKSPEYEEIAIRKIGEYAEIWQGTQKIFKI